MSNKLKKILIVDDDVTQIPIWKHVVNRTCDQAIISWAVSSEQAKTIISQTRFDLIIVDLFLAGSETGLELLETKEVKNSDADTILVTAADKESLEKHIKSRELKNTKIIIKPLNVVRCERVLNEIL